jgi:hypothetical protein
MGIQRIEAAKREFTSRSRTEHIFGRYSRQKTSINRARIPKTDDISRIPRRDYSPWHIARSRSIVVQLVSAALPPIREADWRLSIRGHEIWRHYPDE